MDKIRRVRTVASNLAQNFIRRKVQRSIAHGFTYGKTPIPGLIDIFRPFSPAGLELFINEGGSIVERWLKCIPEDIQNRALLDLEKERNVDAPAIAQSIVWDQVMEVVGTALPEHLKVVKRHPRWYARETQRARDTFLKASPRR